MSKVDRLTAPSRERERESADRLRAARELSWRHLGKRITFYVPGFFRLDGVAGKYPALSVTGGSCSLRCDHCRGKILAGMIPAESPERLVAQGLRLAEAGCHGVLLSGGCDTRGRLPWKRFARAIEEIKARTSLWISVHCGLLDEESALRLKHSGADQALLDIVGDDETVRKVCHGSFGVSEIRSTLRALERAGIPVVPHIVCGLDYGSIRGEGSAVEMISRFHVQQVVIVSLMPLPGTPMERVRPPRAEAVADLIARTRFKMPRTLISLGCARRRGDTRLEALAVEAGVNRLALPSDEAVEKALAYGLHIRYQKTCCSVSRDLSQASWDGDADMGAR